MATIAVGGFQHETNTFAPAPATLADFQQASGWPGLTRGGELPRVFTGMNIPIAGFLDRLRTTGHTVYPLTWAAATPSAQVTEQAFETICGYLVDDLAGAGKLDGVYLDLHGAMVTDHLHDGEAEVVRRVRTVTGSDVPIIVSLDLHANVSRDLVDLADLLVAYRTYPHIDMAATGARCAKLWLEWLAGERPRKRAFRQIPFLIPVTAQCTDLEPTRGLMRAVAAAEGEGVTTVSFAPGFPPADIPDCGPSLFAYGADQNRLDQCVAALADAVEQAASAFETRFFSPDAALDIALEHAAGKPVILADTQDNPGAGGTADTIGIVEALIRRDIPGSAIGVIHDPETAAQAHAAGAGKRIAARLGAKSGGSNEQPLVIELDVRQLGDGVFTAPGPFAGGAVMHLGPMARLAHGNVEIVVASRKEQTADREMLRHVGLQPEQQRILAVKSSVHFRADFAPIAAGIVVVQSPGANPADPGTLNYRHLRPGLRTRPV